ncbi:uncharacterized protein LOC142536753 isoform X2 [Primulina tabacum]|uniref:uncharacterized protein LOC142536753 isoform X2 n=1 Tax=Primulina tabacum TaxID=48773 RepID=UPI003F59BC49
MPIISRPFAASRVKDSLLLLSAALSISLLLYLHHLHVQPPDTAFEGTETPPSPPYPPPITVKNLLFSIASSASSFASRAAYVQMWHNPISHLNTTFLFLDLPVPNPSSFSTLPPIIIPQNSSYLTAGHRIARIVKDAFALNIPDISWYVFGDDDTVFFTDNLVKILSKYDHSRWYYIGCSSEIYEQNEKFSFDMAFGGGGYAISAPLVQAMHRVLDSCLNRYPHLYGSDARIFACVSELGVRLTVEPGFHQVDIRGNLFGMLSSHPLSLVASLHHIDAVEPIFPGMSRIHSLEHLFKAAHFDPARILQQTVCYDRTNELTVSISWGYAIQLYEENMLLPEVLSLQRTFRPWKRGRDVASSHFMFNTREFRSDPCERPVVFFLNNVVSDSTGISTNYTRHDDGKCVRRKAIKNLKVISVFSVKQNFDIEQLKAPRRHCCDISVSFDETMIIQIRNCGTHELISMRG